MDSKKIGKFILLLREEKGYTQKQLSEKINVTDKAISKWENGRGLPDCMLLKPLADVLGVSVNELLSGERHLTLESKELVEKSDEIIVTTLKSSKKSVKFFKAIIAIILSLALVFGSFIIYLYVATVNNFEVKGQYAIVSSARGIRLVDDNIYTNDRYVEFDIMALNALKYGVTIEYFGGEFDADKVLLSYEEARENDEKLPIGKLNDTRISDVQRQMLIIFFEHRISIRQKYTAYKDANNEKAEDLQAISDRYVKLVADFDSGMSKEFNAMGYNLSIKRSGWSSINYEITPFINAVFSEEGFAIIEDMIEFCENSNGGCGSFEEHNRWYELKEQYLIGLEKAE